MADFISLIFLSVSLTLFCCSRQGVGRLLSSIERSNVTLTTLLVKEKEDEESEQEGVAAVGPATAYRKRLHRVVKSNRSFQKVSDSLIRPQSYSHRLWVRPLNGARRIWHRC